MAKQTSTAVTAAAAALGVRTVSSRCECCWKPLQNVAFVMLLPEGACPGCSWKTERSWPFVRSVPTAKYCLQAGAPTMTTRTGSTLWMRYARSSCCAWPAGKQLSTCIQQAGGCTMLLCRSSKKVAGNIPCCHTTKVPFLWQQEEAPPWQRQRPQSHAQLQRQDVFMCQYCAQYCLVDDTSCTPKQKLA